MSETKTPNKRKSLPNNANSAKKGKFTPKKTPNKQQISPKPQNNNTPNKNVAVNKGSPNKKNFKTPNKNNTPIKKQENSPAEEKGSPDKKIINSSTKKNKKNDDDDLPKKIKSFEGTKKLGFKNKLNESKSEKVLKISDEGKIKKGKRGHQFKNVIEKARAKDPAAAEDIKRRIANILARPELTKSARRKIGILKRLQLELEGKAPPKNVQVAGKKVQATSEKNPKQGNKQNNQPKPKGPKPVQLKKPVVQEEEEDDEIGSGAEEQESGEEGESGVEEEEDDESGAEEEDDESGEEEGGEEAEDDEDDDDSDESDYVVEKKVIPAKVTKKMNAHLDEPDSDDEPPRKKILQKMPNKNKPPKNQEIAPLENKQKEKKEKQKEKKDQQNQNKELKMEDLKKNDIFKKGQTRYVLFVGNIPFDATKPELIEHFKKVGEIKNVRIPLDTKTNKPRGFAYLEVGTEEVYQKALSMHHTMLRSRRLNVLYTQSGKKKPEDRKKEIKLKNMKLHAMRKGGQLKGSVKQSQKRSFRRNKQKNFNKKEQQD